MLILRLFKLILCTLITAKEATVQSNAVGGRSSHLKQLFQGFGQVGQPIVFAGCSPAFQKLQFLCFAACSLNGSLKGGESNLLNRNNLTATQDVRECLRNSED
jgi:hypothetical protein